MPSRFFITGTDTGVGKTVVSALLCAALDASYWKPVQTGTREGSDRVTVMKIAGLPKSRTIPEVYRFSPPVSPHLAARQARRRIELQRISPPPDDFGGNLIVEGAGGTLVPLNDKELMIDLMRHLDLPVLVVARTTLGTINHTLLTLSTLAAARVGVRGVIMVGRSNRENRAAIEHYGQKPVIGRLPILQHLYRSALTKAFRQHFDRSAFRGE
jgi:dethiobiotin synthetase